MPSPGLMHETGCSGLVHWDDPEEWDGEGGEGGVQGGEHMYTHGFIFTFTSAYRMGLAEALFLIFPWVTHVSTDIWSLSWAALSRWPHSHGWWLVLVVGGPHVSRRTALSSSYNDSVQVGHEWRLEMAPSEAKAWRFHIASFTAFYWAEQVIRPAHFQQLEKWTPFLKSHKEFVSIFNLSYL